MQLPAKKILLFFGVLAGFIGLLVAGSNIVLERISDSAAPQPTNGPVPPKSEQPPASPLPIPPAIKGGGESYHIRAGTVDRRPITYTAPGFTPREVIIQSSDDLGCLITVINGSKTPLRIGVDPHDPSGDPGANYGVIAPGNTGILDVRYPGFEALSLHDHDNPTRGFRVIYGQGCRF